MGTPVKVYRSSDTDAPQLSGVRGDFKTVLKACLTNGFGAGANRKEPLGWEIVPGTETADGYDCAFRPTDPTSAKNIVHIACPSGIAATLFAYFDTDVAGALSEKSGSMTDLPTFLAGGTDWIVIGHAKAFMVIVKQINAVGGAFKGGNCSGLFFGEIADRINNPRGNTLIARIYAHAQNFSANGFNTDMFWAGNYTKLSSNLTGANKWVTAVPNVIFKAITAGYSQINSEMIFTKIGFTENGVFRGFFPAGYFVHHHLKTTENYKIVQINGVNHLLCNLSTSNTESVTASELSRTLFMLINLEEWD